MRDRLNAVVIAHEFSPVQGSECAVGWNLVTRLAAHHNITVLYAGKYKGALKEYQDKFGLPEGLQAIPVENPWLTNIVMRITRKLKWIGPVGFPPLYYLGYRIWQRKAFHLASSLHAKSKFDVAHQLTQITFREPGYLWKLDIPFIWGPTGATAVLPLSFYRLLPPFHKVIEVIRTFSNFIQYHFYYRVRTANQKACVIYAFSREDLQKFKKRANGSVKIMLDVGTYAHTNKKSGNRTENDTLRAIWCGQLNHRKAPGLLLNVLASDKSLQQKLHVQIIGDGPLNHKLKAECSRLGISNIEWIRKVSHEEVFELMSRADFFIHTSLREATSSVIPEALSMGLPVVCHDVNGMSIAIDERCGLKVPLESPEKSISGFYEAIVKLCEDDELRRRLAEGASARAKEISWEVMAKNMADDYVAAVGAFQSNTGLSQDESP